MAEPSATRSVKIARIDVHLIRAPLLRPYRIAFGDLLAFDTLLVELTDADGRSGFGEATFLPGYGEERIEDGWTLARQLADQAAGSTAPAYRALVQHAAAALPFTATAFVTALEMLEGNPLLALPEERRVPLLALLNADDRAGAERECDALLAQGYRTFKIKVGLAGSDDVARLRWIQQTVAGRARLRVDANQAFSGPEAAAFLAALDPQDIELFEQPCPAGDWAAHAEAARSARVPLMLDESIYGLADIERAAAQGLAAYIKVKAVKFVALDRLAESILRIEALGMRAVLGNGVACDIGCWMEACVAARHIRNAGEMNGYLKLRRPLLANPPRLVQGEMVLEPGYRPLLDRASLAEQRLALHTSRAARPAAVPSIHPPQETRP